MELCNIMRELLHIGAYVDLVQNTLVQAQVNIFFEYIEGASKEFL